MSVIRVNKNKNYTCMSNYHLRDKNLSYKAKGLLSFMLSLPDDWEYSVNGLTAVSKESTKAIRSTLKELEDYKYLIRKKIQHKNGRFDYDYLIYETPYTQNVHTDEVYTNNGLQINTNNKNTNYKDKIDKTINPIIKELINKEFITETAFDLNRYNDLLNDILNEYDYIQVIICVKYVLRKWNENKKLDEDCLPIRNQFSYFKTSLENNLKKMTTDIDLDWLDL